VVDADGKTIVDALNSDVGEVHVERDVDGTQAWDQIARQNAAFIAWCFNHRTEISNALRATPSGFRLGVEAAAMVCDERISHHDQVAANHSNERHLRTMLAEELRSVTANVRSLTPPDDDALVERALGNATKCWTAAGARAEKLSVALESIRDMPIPEQDNMVAANMREIARAALKAMKEGM
jgi:hypothetical protein